MWRSYLRPRLRQSQTPRGRQILFCLRRHAGPGPSCRAAELRSEQRLTPPARRLPEAPPSARFGAQTQQQPEEAEDGTDYVVTGRGRALMVEGAAVGSPPVPR